MAKLFMRGYDASRAEKERQDKARENMGKKLWRFFLKEDGEEAELHFLTEEPVNFYEHNVKTGSNKFEQFVCTKGTEKVCPFCEEGDKPTYKGAYLVVDHREYEYTDSNGKKKKGRDQVRLFIMGMRVVSQLDRISTRYGLSNRDVNIIRLGKGTDTTYTVEREDECDYTEKEIKALLPEKLREEYDGSEDSLMNIVEEQLMMMTKDYDPAEDGESEDDGEDDGRGRLIGMDDDDEEEPPKKRPALRASSKNNGKKSLFKKPRDSRKPTAKSLLKRG